MDLGGIFSIIAFVIGLVLLLPLLVGAVFVVVVVANRAEPDPTGRRPAVVYGYAIAFFTLFATLFATTAFVASLCRLIGSNGGMPMIYPDGFSIGDAGGHQHPLGDSVARGAVLSAIVAIVTGIVFFLHWRAATRATADTVVADPLARVRSSYGAAVCFVSVTVAVGATVVVLYDIFRGIAPGVFTPSGHGGSVEVLRSMIPALYLAVGAIVILLWHLRQAPPQFRPSVFGPWFRGPAPATEPEPAPLSAPPTAAVTDVIDSTTATAPRKRATTRPTPPRTTPPRKTTPRKSPPV